MGWVSRQNGYYLQGILCLHRSPGIVRIEKWRRLRWVGYLSRIDITYKKLCEYTGNLLLSELRNGGGYDELGV